MFRDHSIDLVWEVAAATVAEMRYVELEASNKLTSDGISGIGRSEASRIRAKME
jgi:hypothetical protein